MRAFYDLHLHSCLSPCGDDDMTPCNMVNMAKLLGYDIIALTDHNTCRNTPAAVQAGEAAGLVVVPGMELCTEEEAHVVCLFPDVPSAEAFEAFVKEKSYPIQNKPEIFGHQYVMDAEDHILDEEERLLINATQISVNRVCKEVVRFGGTAFPAHVDKTAYSVIASLGAIPPEAGFLTAEISFNGTLEKLLKTNPELAALRHLHNSDSHYLEHMRDPSCSLELPACSAKDLIQLLNEPKGE